MRVLIMKMINWFNKGTLKPIYINEIGKGWASNTVNTVIFKHHGIVTRDNFQICAYYDNEGFLIICKRDLNNGNLEKHQLEKDNNTFDAHNSISIGIDGENYIHISYDNHTSKLKYRRSMKPLDIYKWTEDLQMVGSDEESVTYPSFLMLPINKHDNESKGEMLFLYRNGYSGKGDAIVNSYDLKNKDWKRRCECLLKGSDQKPWSSNAYWNHPSSNGKKFFISYVWRVKDGGPDEYVNNCNIGFIYSNDNGVTWKDSKDNELKLPITQVNSEVIRGVPMAQNLINQTSQAIDNKGNLHIVYYSNDLNGIPQYQHLWFDGVEWKNKIISDRKLKFDLKGCGALKLPISRPEILIDSNDTVYIIIRADYTKNKMSYIRSRYPYRRYEKPVTLWDKNLWDSEPVIDRIRWKRDGILSMFIQKNLQPNHDIIDERQNAESCYIVDWKLR